VKLVEDGVNAILNFFSFGGGGGKPAPPPDYSHNFRVPDVGTNSSYPAAPWLMHGGIEKYVTGTVGHSMSLSFGRTAKGIFDIYGASAPSAGNVIAEWEPGIKSGVGIGYRAGVAILVAVLGPEAVAESLGEVEVAEALGEAEAAEGAVAETTEAATQPTRIYSARELIRRAEEPGPFHNFPESFNQQIFDQGTATETSNFWRTAKPNLSNDSIMYKLPGNVNGVDGVFEIGVRPSVSGNTELIMHRFFSAYSMTTTTPQFDLRFTHAYECEITTETSGREVRRIFFPDAFAEGGRNGLTISISPHEGEPWLGTFAFGRVTPKAVTGVFSTPNPTRLCVVAQGSGFLVSVSEPNVWEAVRAIPVIDVRSVLKHEVIVFAIFTELVAYGADGIRWRTKRLTWDNMKVVEVTEDQLTGEFWDIQSESTQTFVVDLASGSHRGGIEEF